MSVSVKFFWRGDCPKCPAAKTTAHQLLEDGVAVEFFNMDEPNDLAEGAFHSVMAVPTFLLVNTENDKELAEWRGKIPQVSNVIDAARFFAENPNAEALPL